KEGDFVKRDEPIVALESDKANVEVPAPVGGILKQVLKGAGSKVTIGEVLARIEPATMRLSRQALGGTPIQPTPAAPSVLAAVTTPPKATPRSTIEKKPEPTPAAAPSAPATTTAPGPTAAVIEEPHLSPSQRRIAREKGVEPSLLPRASATAAPTAPGRTE